MPEPDDKYDVPRNPLPAFCSARKVRGQAAADAQITDDELRALQRLCEASRDDQRAGGVPITLASRVIAVLPALIDELIAHRATSAAHGARMARLDMIEDAMAGHAARLLEVETAVVQLATRPDDAPSAPENL